MFKETIKIACADVQPTVFSLLVRKHEGGGVERLVQRPNKSF